MIRSAILFFIISLFSISNLYSSHIAGSDITYKNVGQDSFVVTVKVFRDCAGIDLPNKTIDIDVWNSCDNTIINQTIDLQPPSDSSSIIPGPSEVSQI